MRNKMPETVIFAYSAPSVELAKTLFAAGADVVMLGLQEEDLLRHCGVAASPTLHQDVFEDHAMGTLWGTCVPMETPGEAAVAFAMGCDFVEVTPGMTLEEVKDALTAACEVTGCRNLGELYMAADLVDAPRA
jgi:hypothetical protein